MSSGARKLILRSLVFAAAALVSVRGLAQDAPPQAAAPAAQLKVEAPQPVDEVVVRGRRMSEIESDLRVFVQEFIGKVTAPVEGRGYARWNRRVCIGIHNLQTTDAAQYIVDRISQEAVDVGLEPGEPGCRPDVVIIFTTDAKQLATYLVKNRIRLFLPGMGRSGMNLSREALDAFAKSDKPVRWWDVSMPVDPHTGGRAIRLAEDDSAPTIAVEGPSRIHSGTRDDLQQVIIIVDGTKLHGTTWQQLADYLAVVSLAQVNPEADLAAFDSILNLFSNPKAYSGLTDWDRSYMRALYSYDPERTPVVQRLELVTQMTSRESKRAEQ
jgi:hypothetical protein